MIPLSLGESLTGRTRSLRTVRLLLLELGAEHGRGRSGSSADRNPNPAVPVAKAQVPPEKAPTIPLRHHTKPRMGPPFRTAYHPGLAPSPAPFGRDRRLLRKGASQDGNERQATGGSDGGRS